jgi:hypothetical protein
LAAVAALSVPFWPLAPILRELDDRLHHAVRAELVRRVEAGEFSPWSRYGDMINLPPDYAWAVSRCGGNRLASVQLVGGAPRMTFCGLNGWIVYDALGRAPDPAAELRGFGFSRVERVREHWYWLT